MDTTIELASDYRLEPGVQHIGEILPVVLERLFADGCHAPRDDEFQLEPVAAELV